MMIALASGQRALTSEDYKGPCILQDTEIFILPYFQYTMPKVARKLLMYPIQYPWKELGIRLGNLDTLEPCILGSLLSLGRRETPEWATINILTGKATKVRSGIKEHHITADIAFAVWNYYLSTGDEEFTEFLRQ